MGWTKKSKKPRLYFDLLSIEKMGLIEETKIEEFRTVSFRLINLPAINGIDTTDIDFLKYVIQIKDHGSNHPTFSMLSPEVNVKCPHVYNNTKGLCLFHNSEFSWTGNSTFGIRLVLILYTWIFFYDVWCKTKIWYGPEHSHELK